MTDAVRALLDTAGVSGRRLRTVVRLLTESPQTLASLVGESGADRRSVQAVLAAIGDDLVSTGDRVRLDPAKTEPYRELIEHARLEATEPADPLAYQLGEHGALLTRMQQWIDGAPGPREALDHVSATATTAVRRALWLDGTFDLDGARLLCVGDHDLTSLALTAVNPRVAVTVVDVDDSLLEYIDGQAHPSIRCLWADLRFGLPAGAQEWGDLVFTDPPYTPEGVRLFLARGLAGLREREHARLVMAYGFPEHHPALGLKVQQAVAGLHLAYEAILPGFNRYHGAQAIGGRSDLYVLRPTARSWRALEAVSEQVNIYTRGAQAVEGLAEATAAMFPALRDAAAGPRGLTVEVVKARDLLTLGARRDNAIAVDVTGDPGGWLARALLALDAPRLAILVPNNHPDLANEAAQRSLTELVSTKYLLRLRRSTPDPRHAIVEADRISDDGSVVRAVVDRAHGKVGNTWREALIRASGGALTKNEARQRIRDAGVPPDQLSEPLISLPRHHISAVLRAAADA
jgi:predicted methyltransferase